MSVTPLSSFLHQAFGQQPDWMVLVSLPPLGLSLVTTGQLEALSTLSPYSHSHSCLEETLPPRPLACGHFQGLLDSR